MAEIQLDTGELIAAHCPNSGSMKGCSEPGSPVFVSRSDNPKRKLKYTWELIRTPSSLVGINTLLPNRLVHCAIQAGRIPDNYMYYPKEDLKSLTNAKRWKSWGSGAVKPAYRENLCLRPGESCTWLWDNVGKWYQPGEKFAGGPAFKFTRDRHCKQAFAHWEPYKKLIKNGCHKWSDVYYRYYGNAIFETAAALTAEGLAGLGATLENVGFARGGGAVVVDQHQGLDVRQLANGNHGVVGFCGQVEVGVDDDRFCGPGWGHLDAVGARLELGIVGDALEGGIAECDGTVDPNVNGRSIG